MVTALYIEFRRHLSTVLSVVNRALLNIVMTSPAHEHSGLARCWISRPARVEL